MDSIWNFAQPALAFSLLTIAVWEDLRARKVRNQLLLFGLGLILTLIGLTQGTGGFINSGLSLLTACVAILPLYLLRILGGGDVKLFIVISLLFTWEQVLIALFASLVWGSLLGIFQVILKGHTKKFLHNMLALAHRTKLPTDVTHQIPYTVALLLGFATSSMGVRW